MPTSVPLAAVRILRPFRVALVEDGQPSTVPAELDPTDPITLCNEFDRGQAVQDLTNQLKVGGFTDIGIVPISLDTVADVADRLEQEMIKKREHGQDLVVFQLCDGTELDGYPGVSIIQELEAKHIPYTGSDAAFYIITSSKPILKRELQRASVPTSSFQEFKSSPQLADLKGIIKQIGFPMIVKPSISYASLNISMASVVHTPEQLLEQVNVSLRASMTEGKGSVDGPDETARSVMQNKLLSKEDKAKIDIETPTVFVEKFLAGREFTALVVGDKDWGVQVYPVAERAFDSKLGKFERLLAFDKYWDGYDLEGGQGNEDFCKYQMADEAWQEKLKQVAKDAYLALDGSGYGRVDIRTVEMDVCEPVVLEVNANCGLSFEKDSSSMANILLMSKVAPPGFVRDLIEHALHRSGRLREAMAHRHHSVHRPSSSTIYSNENLVENVEVLVRS
ncbi:hypothetical protein BGZ75_005359 [Mortierella antarctica]|nr:hypothetical protein BGZ75_005359 [Mortierella antarctica]